MIRIREKKFSVWQYQFLIYQDTIAQKILFINDMKCIYPAYISASRKLHIVYMILDVLTTYRSVRVRKFR